ncbi:MAG TPA: hypothetical protein VKP13_04990 [Nitrospira sp.]|nr:hypothetical protein [Nitrospira sp.]
MASANRAPKPLTIAEAGQTRERCQAGLTWLLLLTSIVGLGGCHISWPFEHPAPPLNNAQFMAAWKTYLHCRSSIEPDEIRSDLHRLKRVTHTVTVHNQVSDVLPAAIRFLIAAPPSRLAVDPDAMVVACARHGSHVAQSAGQPELSVEVFPAVVAEQKGAARLTLPLRVDESPTARRTGVSFGNR